MTKTFFLLFFLLSACAVTKTNRPPAFPSDAQVRTIDVSSAEQAKKVIDNHVRFLELLFEQSRDPYYGELKWSKPCLSENVIGKRIDFDGAMHSSSTLYLDSNGKPGHCSGVKHVFALVYCAGSAVVIETKFPISETTYDPSSVCH